MAVLVEALSVIIRKDAIASKFTGGWSRFLECVPNNTFCSDGEIARVGFMTPDDVGLFITRLEKGRLVFLRDGSAMDIAVVDQMQGPTTEAKWLQFARLSINDDIDQKVSACWLMEDSVLPSTGIRLSQRNLTLAVPEGWVFAQSMSANSKFISNENLQSKVKFLRHENGVDVYLDLDSKQELFIGRPKV